MAMYGISTYGKHEHKIWRFLLYIGIVKKKLDGSVRDKLETLCSQRQKALNERVLHSVSARDSGARADSS